MKIEEHARRIRLSPGFSADTYYFLALQGKNQATIWGFSDLEVAVKVNSSLYKSEGNPRNYAAINRMNERLTYAKIYPKNVQRGAKGRLISLPKQLMKKAHLEISDEVEVQGASHAFYIKKKNSQTKE